ncbi:Transmembrane protein 35-like Protein [Tribolium castaneum]|uniref:Novel acetylcholine receptor chaperone n=1 Tax=Tribolium castaneum TaxID=7070 RepID=D6WJE9_TRICA|nr:Transmembrane protein 35-like Protein [Tribolium castaneum]
MPAKYFRDKNFIYCIRNKKRVYYPVCVQKRKEYVKYAKVFPFSEALDFKIPSKWYRRTVGTLEIVCGIAMAFVPNHKVKNGANLCLLLLTLMAVYSHYMVADKLERTAPALVFLFMLSGRLVVYYQLTRREAERPEATVNGFKQE